MRVGELARRTGVTVRALRYYEAAGLVVPRRLTNGYRDYAPTALAAPRPAPAARRRRRRASAGWAAA
ncbi:MerR family DNA-binding transcriptional regulator [Streptomyces mirabilis]|uniref:MerR family DNA-binding transcriptional regulator n=1 Tax=Streptomyces mirabilis TaxID=68239 RepID=UPI0028F713ED|nr:MerR family DNA-binding transcriptional regulator [Streptomyces mirabilis]